jgi:anti-sigma factor RsiW
MVHTTEDEIEQLALGTLTTQDSIRVQRHIFDCPNCLKRLIEIAYRQELQGLGPKPMQIPKTRKPLSFVHDTADGLIHSKVERRGRKWLARHWGEQLDGMRECATVREANEFVVTSFNEMFPEHRCTARCSC